MQVRILLGVPLTYRQATVKRCAAIVFVVVLLMNTQACTFTGFNVGPRGPAGFGAYFGCDWDTGPCPKQGCKKLDPYVKLP